MSTFTNQVAVITGASSGIGKAIALELAMEGASLCLVGRKIETLEAVAKLALTHTSKVRCCQADLSSREQIYQFLETISNEYERIDLLIHSAGAIFQGRIETTQIEEFDRLYQVNVCAPYLLTQGLLPLLRASHGQVVFINSSTSIAPAKANSGPYTATKYGLKAIADSLRDDVNGDGIRVLSVFPGRTASPMQAEIYRLEGRPYRAEQLLQPEDIATLIVHSLGLPRTAEVTDIHMRPFVKSY